MNWRSLLKKVQKVNQVSIKELLFGNVKAQGKVSSKNLIVSKKGWTAA